jgi:hypothetical protein
MTTEWRLHDSEDGSMHPGITPAPKSKGIDNGGPHDAHNSILVVVTDF